MTDGKVGIVKERRLRGMHRRIGILLALFVLIQVASGAAISLYHIIEGGSLEKTADDAADRVKGPGAGDIGHEESELEEMLEFLHKKGGTPGDVYRVLVGSGLMVMVVSGLLINREIGRRGKAMKSGFDERGTA